MSDPQPGGRGSAGAGGARRTGTGPIWSVALPFLVVLVPLVIFLAQNTSGVRLTFVTLHVRIPLGVAMLLSAVGGALLVWLAAVARTWHIRRTRPRR